jgi:hypothetical protein
MVYIDPEKPKNSGFCEKSKNMDKTKRYGCLVVILC